MNNFDFDVFMPPFMAGLLVVSTHVPLGRQVLERGIIFIDLAVAQVAGIGVIGAHTLGLEAGGWGAQIAAVAAALGAAMLLSWTDRRWPGTQEPLIGVVFVLAATASILLVSGDPHGGERLKDILAGQILWVTYGDLLPVSILYGGILALWALRGSRLGTLGFYSLFAITVTASVQMVGVYLVFATLIIPALATRKLSFAHTAGYLLGALGYATGLLLSTLHDLPAGPVIVWALGLLGTGLLLLRRLA